MFLWVETGLVDNHVLVREVPRAFVDDLGAFLTHKTLTTLVTVGRGF